MADLCYPADRTLTRGDSPAALGNRIAARIIERTLNDGSREADGYVSTDYRSVNEPMDVKQPGTQMADPNRWQPLVLDELVAQNGLPLPLGPQTFVGPHWGKVAPFALAGARHARPAHRPGRAAAAARPAHGRRVQGGGRRGPPPTAASLDPATA